MIVSLPFPDKVSSKKGAWTLYEIALLRQGYASGAQPSELASSLGRTPAAVRNKAYELRITSPDNSWSESELERIKQAYSQNPLKGELNLKALSQEMGRPKTSICVIARSLGLTNIARKGVSKPKVDKRKYKTDEERKEALSARMRQQHKERGHPMKGKNHSEEARRRISAASKATWVFASEEKRAEWTDKRMKSRSARHGSLAPQRPGASWKAGWREVGGKRNYYRSRWEANYARYLQWLKEQGQIVDWVHEPETFWFEAIKRGVRSYLPDFRVTENDGTSNLHEVKGWMDARSKTTLKRMAKYHPGETIVLIREKQYNEIARKVGPMIDGWESGGRSGRP